MGNPEPRGPVTAVLAAAVSLALVGHVPAAETSAALKLEPKAAQEARVGYFPVQAPLSAEKPAGVKKEPQYRAAPKYAKIRIGNGAEAEYLIAVDEPEGADFKIYLDANRNGDLTDDGDGAWKGKREGNGRTMYGVNEYVLNGSWKDAAGKASSEPYGIALYRFVGQNYLLMYRQAGRTGMLTVDGKPHKALLVENDADGLFSKPVASVEDARKTRPVWLLLDLNDDGNLNSRGGELFDIRGPFKLGEKTYEATVAADGSTLKLAETTKQALDLTPKPAARPELLAAGTAAPDFTAEKWGGGELKLSDYKGKVVILDFWATWCGPCQRSMPHLEKVYQAVKKQDVVVLAVCVWDEKDDYSQWVPANREKYSFQFAFDPAGKADTNIAKRLYNVSGIPTTYVIDKEGKVAAGIVGFNPNNNALEKALEKLGIRVDVQASAR